MKVTYKGRLVEASEIRDPSGDRVTGYQIGTEIVMPQQVQLPNGEPASVEVPDGEPLKAKRKPDPTIK